ncbi:MAG: glycosyltransferase 87 family protein [Candidatus Dormibacteria bacterium]
MAIPGTEPAPAAASPPLRAPGSLGRRLARACLRALGTPAAPWVLIIAGAAGTLLGALWIGSAVAELSGPITQAGHHDFFAFYSAASLVHGHQPQSLYDAGAMTALERRIYNHPTGYAGYMPFINPPSAAALLSPLSLLPEAGARLVWLAVSLLLALACALLLTRGRDLRIRALALLVVLACFPAYQTFTEGQWSLVMLLGCLGALAAGRRGHPWLAGAALTVLWLKPPLLLLVLVWLLVTGRWRVAAGMIGAVAAVTLAALPWTGIPANLNYAHYLTSVLSAHVSGAGAVGQTAWEGALPNMEGLIGLAAAVFGQQDPLAVDVATGAAAAALVGFFAWAMRGRWRDRPLPLRHGLAAVCLGLLLDPHLYAQDCMLILVLVALVLAALPRGPRARGTPINPLRVDATVLLAGLALLDLSAIDTLWLQTPILKPLHLLTVALIAGVVILAWPGNRPGGERSRPRALASSI